MKNYSALIIMVILIIFYSLHAGFVTNQPIEYINPLDFYPEAFRDLSLAYSLFILMTPVALISIFIGFMNNDELGKNRKFMFLLMLCITFMVIFNRFSILILIPASILLKSFIKSKLNNDKNKILNLSLYIYFGMLFLVIIPLMILWMNKESFLNINGFSKLMEYYNDKGDILSLIKGNMTMLDEAVIYYAAFIIIVIIPCILFGIYLQNMTLSGINRLLLMAVLLIAGTFIKVLITFMQYHPLMMLLIMAGSTLQAAGLGIGLFYRSFINKKIIVKQKHFLYFLLAVIFIIEILSLLLLTGNGFGAYGRMQLDTLLGRSALIGITGSIIMAVFLMKYRHNQLD